MIQKAANVFVLNTGRCGSVTFIKACQHITNFSSAHESRSSLLGDDHFSYPSRHIEADNRLSWLLGRLDRKYGDNAHYIHLRRNTRDVAVSFVKRYGFGIIHAYRGEILMGVAEDTVPMSVAMDYCDTVNANIELFLKDKTRKMKFNLESAKQDWPIFWELIGAEGNIEKALLEFDVRYNASESF
jgi:hypothetical protein